MSYAMYEPMDSMQPAGPPAGQMPGQMDMRQTPHQLAQKPPVNHTEESKNVQVPAGQAGASKWKDISEYEEIPDWISILLAILIVDIIVIVLIRTFPDFFGRWVNLWYNRFGLLAVIGDVTIIGIGFAIARYIYTEYIYPTNDWNPLFFTGVAVAVQLVHDVLFYFGVIKTVPQGSNAMMDVFREYAEEGGAKILAADAAMVIGSSVIAMLLKSTQPHILVAIGLVSAYALPYCLTIRNQYSNMV